MDITIDVDDYKLFGMESAKRLTNAKRIMDDCNVERDIQEQVCHALNNIGYSKKLKGHCPTTIEGKIVSDADMCDALGSNGILRVYTYSMKNGKPFFNKKSLFKPLNKDFIKIKCCEFCRTFCRTTKFFIN